MWVFIVLLVVGSSIIIVRLFRNGAREGLAETDAGPAFTSATAPSEVPAHTVSVGASAPIPSVTHAPTVAGPSPAGTEPASPYPPPMAENVGGPCPSCGNETVPGAKFCGECGTRLVT